MRNKKHVYCEIGPVSALAARPMLFYKLGTPRFSVCLGVLRRAEQLAVRFYLCRLNARDYYRVLQYSFGHLIGILNSFVLFLHYLLFVYFTVDKKVNNSNKSSLYIN